MQKQPATIIDEVRYHFLKTWPGPFELVKDGFKTAEIRIFDRDFQVGDNLVLMKFTPSGRHHTETGETMGEMEDPIRILRITDITEGFGLKINYVMLSMLPEPAKSHIARKEAIQEEIAKIAARVLTQKELDL